jgi:hypothetical protein
MAEEPKGNRHTSVWPTVEEQLAAAKVVPGSALDKLIRANQEIAMLRPEEANDKVRLPAWIRIYWRKRHPEAKYIGPGGGYPLVLKQLHDWMVAHQDLPGYDVPDSSSGSNKGGQHAK